MLLDPAVERLALRLGARAQLEVRLASAPLVHDAADLFPEELALVARAVPKRVRELATGRVLARQLLAELGFPPGPLLREESRAPRWPEGAVGSISHTQALCVVAVARASEVAAIGVDVEMSDPLEEGLFSLVLTPAERAALERHPPAERGRRAKLVFSAKECFYKCQYGATRMLLDFEHVEIDLDLDQRSFRARVRSAEARARLEALGRLPAEGVFELEDPILVTGMLWPALR